MNGFILVHKPAGITSFDVIRIARKKLGMKKIGHAGTLDPFATGLLILAVGEGTKALSQLLLSEKAYRTNIAFGVTSDTLDVEGTIIPLDKGTSSESHAGIKGLGDFAEQGGKPPCLERKDIESALQKFKGEIEQIPPKYSAIKINGKRACDRVRNGEEVEIPIKRVSLYESEVLGFDNSKTPFSPPWEGGNYHPFPILDIRIRVSSGFYVRSFARDLAEYLGTIGLCKSLCRESIGNFSLNDAVSPDDISAEHILPFQPEHFSLPFVFLEQYHLDDFFHGRRLSLPDNGGLGGLLKREGETEVSVFVRNEQYGLTGTGGHSFVGTGEHAPQLGDNWIGFGKIQNGFLYPKKVVNQK